MKRIHTILKSAVLLFLLCPANSNFAQSSGKKNEIGLTIFNICEDISGTVPHATPGIQYGYHFKYFTIKTSLTYFGSQNTFYPTHFLDKTVLFTAGIEKPFFKGRFQLTQGINFFVKEQFDQVTEHHVTDTFLNTFYGPALTGGFIYHVTPYLSVSGYFDVEFYALKDYHRIDVAPVRQFSVNYCF